MSGKDGYFYDKYSRGVRYFVSGLILTIYGFLELAGLIDTAGLIVDML